MPTVSRPFEMLSTVASCLASSAPLPRNGAIMIAVTNRILLVTAAAAASVGIVSWLPYTTRSMVPRLEKPAWSASRAQLSTSAPVAVEMVEGSPTPRSMPPSLRRHDDGVQLIPADALTETVRAIFAAAGCDDTEATRIATELVEANLTGHDSHGVVRVQRYLAWLRSGSLRIGQHVSVVTDGGAFVVLDGQRGFGQTVATEAVALGVERAGAQGSCIVALRNAGHIGRVGRYAETALAAGLLSIHFV